jgi:hypothetical protein
LFCKTIGRSWKKTFENFCQQFGSFLGSFLVCTHDQGWGFADLPEKCGQSTKHSIKIICESEQMLTNIKILINLGFFTFLALGTERIMLSKERWIKEFRAGFVPDICNTSSYFRSCFKVDEKKCHDSANKALDRTINMSKLNKRIEIIQEASAISIDIGEKVGKFMDVDLSKFKKNEPPCNNDRGY